MPTTYTFGSLQFCNGDGTGGYYLRSLQISYPHNLSAIHLPRNDVGHANDDKLGPVEFQITVEVSHKTTAATFQQYLRELHQYLNAGAQNLYLDLTTKHYRNVRKAQINSQQTDRLRRFAQMTFTLKANDPFLYYDTTTGSPEVKTPNADPYTWTTTTSGTAYVEPVFLITGPFTGDIRLDNLTRSEWVQLAASLGAGNTLEIDSANRTIKQNGTESYTNITNDNASGGFLKLNAGANNMSLNLGGAPTTGTVTTTWTDRDYGQW